MIRVSGECSGRTLTTQGLGVYRDGLPSNSMRFGHTQQDDTFTNTSKIALFFSQFDSSIRQPI
jgi:hypothetical protein